MNNVFKFHIKQKYVLLSILMLLLINLQSNAQEKPTEPESSEKVASDSDTKEEKPSTTEQQSKVMAFNGVEHVPYPASCAGNKTNDERKKCVSRFIQMHVGRKFDTELPRELGLSPGRKRIFVQFKIDHSGKVVNIQSRAEHPDLEKEAVRVMSMLPEFTPGEHDGEKVTVIYSLPIVFMVEEIIETEEKTKN